MRSEEPTFVTSNLIGWLGSASQRSDIYADFTWAESQHRTGQVDNVQPWEVPCK